MPSLSFPPGEAVGTLEWLGSERGAAPALAAGVVNVPAEAKITLDVMLIDSVQRTDGPDRAFHSSVSIKRRGADGPVEFVAEDSESWEITGSRRPVDLGFLRHLPADGITNLHLRSPIIAGSFDSVTHLAPGLRRLYLAITDLSDDAIATIGALHGLTHLQTWGNQFTDRGVQQLAALTKLEGLYLEEETLSAAAFDFAVNLPHLSRLGVQDVPITEVELAELRRRLPGVSVH
jgi:hypothetical protein